MAGSPRIDELKKKFDENPGRYFAPLANEYRKAGQIDQAIEICRMYLAEKPGHMSGLIVFGQALFEATQLEEARTTFEQALALDPENLIALRHLGDIARQIGDPGAAKGWYQRVLDADPRNEEIAAALAEVSAEAAAAAPAADASSSGMSGWGDINPETSEAAAASTVLIQPTPPATPSSSSSFAPPAPAEPAPQPESRGASTQIPRISLDMSAIESPPAPPVSEAPPPPPSAPPAGVSPESRTLEFVPPSTEDTKRPSLGIRSLGIEQEQEFDSSIAAGAGSPGIELDRPFESPPEAPSGGSPPGLETTEFRPPSEPVRSGRDSISGFQVDEPPAWETHREEKSAPPAPATSFVTETMAELYLKQGYRAEALGVYRQLVEQNPGDAALRDKLRGLEASAEPKVETPAQAAKPARRSGGRNVRTFFGSLGSRKAPARAADAYNATFEKPAEGGPTESGVTGPSDWIMEPAPPPSPAAASEVQAPAAAPPSEAPDAFGASPNAWPEPPRAAEPTPSESGGWGIAPVTPPAPSKTPSPRFGSPVVASAPAAAPERPRTPPPQPAVEPPPQPAPVSQPVATSHSAAMHRDEPEAATSGASGSLDTLFGGASVKAQDADAAEMLAGAFGPPVTTPPSAPQYPGQPARAAASELSLDHVFRDTPRKSGAVRTTGGFSFDQFFSDDAAGREKSDEEGTTSKKTPSGSRESAGGDEAQFSSWLEGLKKK